jgi:hypothetical protein
MNRLELAPDNQLVAQVKKILADIEQIKTAQPIGRKAVTPKIIDSGATYDRTAFVNGPYYQDSPMLTFTADTQRDPYFSVFWRLFDMAGAPLPLTDIVLGEYFTDANFAAHAGTGVAQEQVILLTLGIPFQIKFYAAVSDTGTLLIEGA